MLNGAIIGLGKIAQTCHLPAFNDPNTHSDAMIVAGVETHEQTRARVQMGFPYLRLYSSLDALLAAERIDFIDICSPPNTHAALLRSAVTAGLPVLCEKPLTPDADEAFRLAALLRDSQSVFMPCHQYRYAPLWCAVKEFYTAIPQGESSFARFDVFRTGADPGYSPEGKVWRLDHTVGGGGILADTGVHYLYLALWLAGIPTHVTARTRVHGIGGVHTEDTAVVLLEYPEQCIEVNLTWAAQQRANSVRVAYKNGGLRYDGNGLVMMHGEEKRVAEVPAVSDKAYYIRLYREAIKEFLGMIRLGKGKEHWVDEAFQSIRLLHACYQSAEENRTIRLD